MIGAQVFVEQTNVRLVEREFETGAGWLTCAAAGKTTHCVGNPAMPCSNTPTTDSVATNAYAMSLVQLSESINRV